MLSSFFIVIILICDIIFIVGVDMKRILYVIIGVILGLGIGVGASVIYNAKDIAYSNSKTTATNVSDALDELINDNSTIKTGEAFLMVAKNGLLVKHNYNPYSAYFYAYDLDFSDIKSFDYTYELSTTNTNYQELKFWNDDKTYLTLNSSSSGTCNIEGATGITFSYIVANNNQGIFKITSYIKMNGEVINLS